jgi:hypothetical protein
MLLRAPTCAARARPLVRLPRTRPPPPPPRRVAAMAAARSIPNETIDALAAAMKPIDGDAVFERVKNAKVVLLGESRHAPAPGALCGCGCTSAVMGLDAPRCVPALRARARRAQPRHGRVLPCAPRALAPRRASAAPCERC